MQLCHIHFYQKIARQKLARGNAALDIFWFARACSIIILYETIVC